MSPHSAHFLPQPRWGLGLSLALLLAAPVAAQWKVNPSIDYDANAWNPPSIDATRLVLEDCAFVLQVENGDVRIQRSDMPGYGYQLQPEYWADVLVGWPKPVWYPIQELVGCSIATNEFVIAYSAVGSAATPGAVRVARIVWNSSNDTFTTAPGFPVTISSEAGPHSLAITPRDPGTGIDGVLVAWHTTIAGVTRIYQQGVATVGAARQWPAFPNGVPLETGDLGTTPAEIEKPTIVSTGDGLAVTTYHKKVGGYLKHWTAKLDANVSGTVFLFGTPREVPGQLAQSTGRCCVCNAGNGGAMYGFATDGASSSVATQLVRAEVSGAAAAGAMFWDSTGHGYPAETTPLLRALSFLDMPGQAGLLVYRDRLGIRCINWASGSGGAPSFLWTRFVRGASQDRVSLPATNTDDAATVFSGSRAVVMSTTDEQVSLTAFKADGTDVWLTPVPQINEHTVQKPKEVGTPTAPLWPHLFVVGPNHTPGYMLAWYDEEYFLAERVSTTGKIGRHLVGPGFAGFDLSASALMFDTVSASAQYIETVQLEITDGPGVAGNIDIHVAMGTSRVGIEQMPSAWTLVASVPVTSAGPGNLVDVTLPAPIALPPGTNAVMLRSSSLRLASTPAAGGLATFDLAGVDVVCGAHVASWPAGPLHNGRVFAGALGLSDTPSPSLPAANVVFGSGCYGQSDSFYASYPDAAAAATALSGQSMTMIPTGPGQYLVTSGGGVMLLPGSPVPSSAFLPTADDGVAIFALPVPMLGTTTVHVHTNGGVWVGNNLAALAPNDYTPNAASMLNAPHEGFWCWHDFNIAEPGSGQIWVAVDSSGGFGSEVLIVTWSDVESYPLGVTNRSTIQFQFELWTGIARWVWTHIDNNSTSEYGSGYLVGWSPGGASFDAGSLDLAIALPLQTAVNMWPLALSAAPVPTPGTLMTFQLQNVPEASPGAGVYLGFVITAIGGNVFPGGIDLGFLGAPGCRMDVASFDLVFPVSGVSPTLSVPLTLPANTPHGLVFDTQGFALFAPGSLPNGQNPVGISSSNSVHSRVGH